MVLVAIVGFVFWRDAEQSGGMDRATAIQLTRRGDRLLGGSAGENAWIGRLVSGQVSPGYYLSRQFIAPAYLKRQAEDETFLSEAYHVLTGQIATREQLEPAQSRLLATGSRLEALNSLLELTDGQPIRLPSDPTRLRTFTLAEDRPPAGSDLIGLFTLEAEARLTGDKARFRIYSDGRLRCSQVVAVDDPTVSNNYFIEWDTRVEKPGVRQPSLLVQTADGRGLWLDLDLYNIPVINALTTGIPVNADLDPKQVTWFRLPITKDGAALLTLIDAAASFDMPPFRYLFPGAFGNDNCFRPVGRPARQGCRSKDFDRRGLLRGHRSRGRNCITSSADSGSGGGPAAGCAGSMGRRGGYPRGTTLDFRSRWLGQLATGRKLSTDQPLGPPQPSVAHPP